MIDIKNRDEFEKAAGEDKNLCALFTANWCPDCQVLKPVLPEIESAYGEKFDFVSLDRDLFLDLCQELDVYGIPSFITFRSGQETGRFVSKDAKTRQEIEDFLNSVA